MKSGAIRSRPPSMTSSAAGHGLKSEEMQDHDQLLDEVDSLYSWSLDEESG